TRLPSWYIPKLPESTTPGASLAAGLSLSPATRAFAVSRTEPARASLMRNAFTSLYLRFDNGHDHGFNLSCNYFHALARGVGAKPGLFIGATPLRKELCEILFVPGQRPWFGIVLAAPPQFLERRFQQHTHCA